VETFKVICIFFCLICVESAITMQSAYGRIAVLLLALSAWAFVFLYVYCLKRFRHNFLVKLIALILALFTFFGAVVTQGQLYQRVRAGRFSVNEFNVVVIAESAVALFILFYGMRNFWRKWDSGNGHKSFYEKADRCQGTLLGLLLVP
jgi:hypothetical protein